jgi:hypothetical protein
MKSAFQLFSLVFALTTVVLLGSLSGFAQVRHPAYLHALSDLRAARAHLEHADRSPLGPQSARAVHEIDEAIREIKKAGIDDGKDLNNHPPIDVRLDWAGRRHRALELLDKARSDVAQEEDNRFAQGLQQRALGHIDKAHHHVEEAIHG